MHANNIMDIIMYIIYRIRTYPCQTYLAYTTTHSSKTSYSKDQEGSLRDDSTGYYQHICIPACLRRSGMYVYRLYTLLCTCATSIHNIQSMHIGICKVI